MNITELRGDEALEFLSLVIEPASTIFSDERILELLRDKDEKSKNKVATATSLICKNYKSEAKEILAALAGVPSDKYSANPLQIVGQVAKLLVEMANTDLSTVFFSPEQKTGNTSSGSATENTIIERVV